MTRLDDLKHKYPEHKIKYEPKESCRACGGLGENLNRRGETSLCICTCVGFVDIGGLFKGHVARQLKELRGENDSN